MTIVGDGSVGKTTLIIRYTEKRFRESYIPTIGVQWTVKEILYNNDLVHLILWDIAGQSKFKEVRSNFYAGSNAAIIVFDVTNLISFDHVENWFSEVKRFCGNIPYFLLGNKIDLINERKVTTEMIVTITRRLNLPYFETSAKTGENVIDIFNAVIEGIRKSEVPYITSIQSKITDETVSNVNIKEKILILEDFIRKEKFVQEISAEFKSITNEIFRQNPYHEKLEEMTQWRLEKLNQYPIGSRLSLEDQEEFLRKIETWKKLFN
ncbi:MAG: Rab family GTPase [Candidatus Helarchaeota archaeon]